MEPRNSAILGWEAWLTPAHAPPHMCYHVKLGSSATKGVGINRREPQNWGALGHRSLAIGASLTPRNTLLTHMLPSDFGRSRSNDKDVIKEIRLKI